MESNDVPKWIVFLSKKPILRAYAHGKQKKGRPRNCDQCGAVLGERMYLLVSTRFLFWAKEETCLCHLCYEQHIQKLRQDGLLPAQTE